MVWVCRFVSTSVYADGTSSRLTLIAFSLLAHHLLVKWTSQAPTFGNLSGGYLPPVRSPLSPPFPFFSRPTLPLNWAGMSTPAGPSAIWHGQRIFGAFWSCFTHLHYCIMTHFYVLLHRTQWTVEDSVFGAVMQSVCFCMCMKYLGNWWTDLR